MNQPAGYTSEDENPVYNIGAVARMTDIQETTLRIWERRYDFPESSRTDGGHRLYSPKEVTRLLWVKLRTDEGMQVSKAIKALRHIEEEGALSPTPRPSSVMMAHDENAVTAFNNRLLNALISHNSQLADQLIGEMMAIYHLEQIILDVIVPTFEAVGQAWHDGLINVSTEHFATHYLRHRLLMWMETSPVSYVVHPIVLACAPEEWHEGGLLVMGVLLRRLGWPVIYLGQSVPLDDLAQFVQSQKISAVVVVAMAAASAIQFSKWPEVLPDAFHKGKPLVCYGGRAFVQNPKMIDQTPGLYLGGTLNDGVTILDKSLREMYPLVR